MTIAIESIRAAHRLIEKAIVRTPIVRSATLSERFAGDIFLKLENLQYTGSFKDRGALVHLLALTHADAKRGVIAVSAGNHAQGVAYHARRLGIPATIVMPVGTPFIKIQRTQGLGATVILEGATLDEAETHAHDVATRQGLSFVHPYDDPSIIAGQGTVALEMLADQPDLDCIVVPIGGGGLIAGIATATRAISPGLEIIGVEAAAYAKMAKGSAPGLVAGGTTLADGIAVKKPGQLTRPIIQALVSRLVTVGEASIERAVHMMIEVERLVAEGAGAAALAALLDDPAAFKGRRVGLVVSGGNIDSRLLASVLTRGLLRAGHMATLRIDIADAPGNLARVAAILGEAGANIIEIHHRRLFLDVPVKRVELDVMIETQGPDHVEAIRTALTDMGVSARRLDEQALSLTRS